MYGLMQGSSSKCTQDSSQGSSADFDCVPEIKESSSTSSETGVCNNCESSQKQCIICCAKPANASIIHGKYAHQISCYKCARKLQKQKKRCPICRRTIDRVVHQITNVWDMCIWMKCSNIREFLFNLFEFSDSLVQYY